ncbi:hypothetical protein MGP2080_06132 [marine gamma proteobacterium HTCC2080]|nr:hypothetical protein MGP2080_06132 [marine gamma proteobacterium HTCC2080]
MLQPLMCLSSENQASFDWQVASIIRQEAPTFLQEVPDGEWLAMVLEK